MGKTTGSLSSNGHSPSKLVPPKADPTLELRADIAQTRTQMSGTIDAIEQRLAPGHIKEQVLEQLDDARVVVKAQVKEELREVKEAVKEQLQEARVAFREATIGKVEHMAQDVKATFVETIRDNPIPAALAGIGLAWLFMNRKGARRAPQFEAYRRYGAGYDAGYNVRPTDDLGYRSGLPSERGAVAEKLGQVQESAGRMLHDSQQAVGELAQSAQEKARRVEQGFERAVASGKESLGHLAHDAQLGARRVERRFEDVLRSSPVGVGVAAMAVGTVAGLLIPRTEREDQWMGETRDQLLGRAQHAAEEAIEKAKDLAGEAVSQGEARTPGATSGMGADYTAPQSRH